MMDRGGITRQRRQRRCKTRQTSWEMVSMLRIVVAVALVFAAVPSFAADTLRVGLQKTGTFAWQLDVIKRHGLATAANLDLKLTEMSSADAGKLALNAGSVDVAVVDWLWVARERALGTRLQFYPYSTAIGAIMGSALATAAALRRRFTKSSFGGPGGRSIRCSTHPGRARTQGAAHRRRMRSIKNRPCTSPTA